MLDLDRWREVDHIPTHQETVDKCFEAFEKAHDALRHAEESYRAGYSRNVCVSYMEEVKYILEAIETLIGGSAHRE